MKSHDVAKSLSYLARLLRAGPNVELEDIYNLSSHVVRQPPKGTTKSSPNRNGGALALLAAMSSLSKSEVLQMANDLQIPIEVRKADAVRDIIGKLLKYIQENPEVRERLVQNSRQDFDGDGPKLARALAILMGR